MEKEIHMRFRDVASINLLFAALEKSFPLFQELDIKADVDDGGNHRANKVFHTLKKFSTDFPQTAVDVKNQ
jgi:hypothetical protein